jgi:hypothetical protein
VKDVAALQLLSLLDLFKAYDAGIIDARRQILGGIHIRQPLQLVDELPRLDEELDGLAKAHKSVDDLPQQIERELLSRKDVGEQLDVQEENSEIEDERDDVEDKAFLSPLFPVVQLYQADGVLEVVLDGFEKEPHELTRVRQTDAFTSKPMMT